MLELIIYSLLTVLIAAYVWNYYSDTNIIWRSKKIWIIMFIAFVITLYNNFNSNEFLKIINSTIIFIVIYKFLFKTNIKDSIVGPIILALLSVTCKMLFCVISFLLLRQHIDIYDNTPLFVLINTISVIIMLILLRNKIMKNMYIYLNNLVNSMDEITVIVLSIVAVFMYSVFAVNFYYGINSKDLFVISSLLSLISFGLVLLFFKTKDDYYKIHDKYNSNLLSLKEFENVLNNYRVDNHENKNHLLTIRNMTTNKKVIKFVDTILDNKIKDNIDIMQEISDIPSGGLRGLIYSKLLVMKHKNIDCEIDIAADVRTIDMNSYHEELVLNICKIIGIFLDNAIEEVEELDDRYIIIEMFIENDNLNVSITNTFDSDIDKQDIYNLGYSTKGDNHGYGLTLVKKIVNNSNDLDTYHIISDNEFTQILEINSKELG